MARNIFSVDNMEVHKDKGNVIISINPKVYSLDTIFSAAYILIDKAYVIIDGNPQDELFILLKAKDKKTDLVELGRQFNNELVNYSFYAAQTARSMPIRAAMVQRAFFTQTGENPIVQKQAKERKGGKNKSRKRKSRSKS